MRSFIIVIIGVAFFKTTFCVADERIWLKAKINGKPVHLAFDSGSSGSALCQQTVQRLGLKFIPAPTNNLQRGLLAGDTEDCTLTLEGADSEVSFLVLDLPAYVFTDTDFDGLIGWWSLSQNVMRIDATARELTFLSEVPKETTQWTRLSIVALTNSGALDLQIPHSDRTNGILHIDTGSGFGFAMPTQAWHQWKAAHSKAPITLTTDFTPDDGFFVREEAWADEITIGPVVLKDVPIAQAGPAGSIRWGVQYEGTFGLAALKRLDFIVDGNNSLAYLRAKGTGPPAYPHNRLGAIFVPTSTHTNQAVADVVNESPAYVAGVRNGDVLLQVDDIVVTSWSGSWRSRFCMPAGTKLKLKLKRDGKTFTTTATLREILQPSSDRKY